MICILKIQTVEYSGPWINTGPHPEITGWIIAADLSEARRKAAGAGESGLAQDLYLMEFDPPPGKYDLPTGHILLVD